MKSRGAERGYAAFDDVKIRPVDGARCTFFPREANPNRNIADCTFERDFCHWTNTHGETQLKDWARVSGKIVSENEWPGPTEDFESSNLGERIYLIQSFIAF